MNRNLMQVAREVSDKDVPIWNFENGQSPKGWGFARHIGYSRSLNHQVLSGNNNIFFGIFLSFKIYSHQFKFLPGMGGEGNAHSNCAAGVA